MKKFISEFKEFISRGNVLDLAVGMVMGSAFTAIVGSLVNDIIMPVVGTIIGGINFSNLKVVITPANGDVAEAAITYGNFIQAVVNFLIIAFVIFSVIKGINKMKKQKEEEPAEEPAPEEPSEEILLLREIRDSLKEK